ncbi:hypothetical protein Slala02_75040 [Streptomyces lavendulae subsp. lavendulae]|nr:hypothetical protein Slala01_78150 [Streptomyces lavendulae subsp. lavendulae]GLX31685.1 hypothetical protein Slala02_75040 [Streptomyces lavendulae subsp. lavendulae]
MLMAVINENVSDSAVYERGVELAYIRNASGREFTTAASNVEPAPDQPKTAASRRDQRSA